MDHKQNIINDQLSITRSKIEILRIKKTYLLNKIQKHLNITNLLNTMNIINSSNQSNSKNISMISLESFVVSCRRKRLSTLLYFIRPLIQLIHDNIQKSTSDISDENSFVTLHYIAFILVSIQIACKVHLMDFQLECNPKGYVLIDVLQSGDENYYPLYDKTTYTKSVALLCENMRHIIYKLDAFPILTSLSPISFTIRSLSTQEPRGPLHLLDMLLGTLELIIYQKDTK